MINEERIIDKFLEYIQIDSPSFEEGNFKDHVKKDMEEMGLEVEEDEAGQKAGSNANNLIVRIPGNSDRTLLISAHMDTVSPGKGIKPIVEDDIIRSDGTTILGGDVKAGIVDILEAVKVLQEQGGEHHNIEIVLTITEELGMKGSRNLDYTKLKADFGFVLDSGGSPGYTIIQGPAQNNIKARFKGKASHAGVAPEEGISAIQIAAEAINNMKLLRIDEETTANIGYINGGGPTNIVTSEVEIHGEARSLDNDKLKKQTDHMVACIKDAQEKYGLEAEIEVEEVYKAFKVDRDSKVVNIVEEACNNINLKFSTDTTGGGSDTNNYNLNGIPSVNLGVGMNNPHGLNENIAKQDIIDSARLVLEIMRI